MWKECAVKFGLWIIRTLLREGKKEIALMVVRHTIEDPKVPDITSVLDLGSEHNPFRGIVGRREGL